MSSSPESQIDLVIASSTQWRQSRVGGATVYIYINDLTGAYFATDAVTHGFLQVLANGGSMGQALSSDRDSQAQILRTLPALVDAGILEAAIPSAAQSTPSNAKKPRPPLESRIAFASFEIVEVSWIYASTLPLARWLFGRAGAIAFLLAALLASNAILANTDTLVANLSQIDPLSPSTLVTLSIVLLLLKAVHEGGHALAMAHYMRAEGEEIPPIRAGIAFFFLLPIPFTNTTASWRLKSKWRRAGIGLAGIYLESWVALIATLLWASIGEGELQLALMQVMIVSGVSTLLFNLNPLIRLDGYYVLTDILDQPNLATRAASTARQTGHSLLGVAKPIKWDQLALLGYWAASLGYRSLTMALVAYAAALIDERLGLFVVAIGALILFVRPALNTMTSALKNSGDQLSRVRVRLATIIVIAILLPFAKIPDPLILDGRVEFSSKKFVYTEAPGYVSVLGAVVPVMPGATLVAVKNPELRHRRAIAESKYALANLDYRQAAAVGPEELVAKSKSLALAADEFKEAKRRIETLTRTASEVGIWVPDNRSYWDRSWVEPGSRQSLGEFIPREAKPRLVAYLDQSDAEAANSSLTRLNGELRLTGFNQDFLPVKVVRVTTAAQRHAETSAHSAVSAGAPASKFFQIDLELVEETLPKPAWLHGKHFTVRLEREPRSIGRIYWIKIERLIQKTFHLRENTS